MTTRPRPNDVAFVASPETECSQKYYALAMREHKEYEEARIHGDLKEAVNHHQKYLDYLRMMKGCLK